MKSNSLFSISRNHPNGTMYKDVCSPSSQMTTCKQVLHYFLGDDTIEILELNEHNSGRMHFPMLIRRQKLEKNTPHDLLSKFLTSVYHAPQILSPDVIQ